MARWNETKNSISHFLILKLKVSPREEKLRLASDPSSPLASKVRFPPWVSLAREIELRKEQEKSGRTRDLPFSRRPSCSSSSLPRERASICRKEDRDKPRVKGRKRKEKKETRGLGCHGMRRDTLTGTPRYLSWLLSTG